MIIYYEGEGEVNNVSKDKEGFWHQEIHGEEWVNFGEGVPVDIVIQEAEPEEIETAWGIALVLRVWEFDRDELTGGIRKLLRINSKRLQRGIKNASPGGIPLNGFGYRLTRRGEGWATSYNVSMTGKYTVDTLGRRTLRK